MSVAFACLRLALGKPSGLDTAARYDIDMPRTTTPCPACKTGSLEPSRLEAGLKSATCSRCGGCWINGVEYFDWLASRAAQATPPTEEAGPTLVPPTRDSEAGKLCLDCGRFMRRVAVGHGRDFFLDRCTSCGGFWFDANEWGFLRIDGIHREAHLVFTDAWQSEVRRQAREAADERRLSDRLGGAGLARLIEIKSWIAEHPHGKEMLAMLADQNDG